jgi:hypothetical protein
MSLPSAKPVDADSHSSGSMSMRVLQSDPRASFGTGSSSAKPAASKPPLISYNSEATIPAPTSTPASRRATMAVGESGTPVANRPRSATGGSSSSSHGPLYVGTSYLEELKAHTWYFPDCDRARAERLLTAQGLVEGMFLVRPSST